MFLPERFTAHLRHVLQHAASVAQVNGTPAITPTHLLLALTLERGCLAFEVLANVHVRPDAIRVAIGPLDGANAVVAGEPVPALTLTARRSLEKAALAAATHNHRYVGTEHLLEGLLATEDEQIRAILTALHVDPQLIEQHLRNVLTSTSKFPELTASMTEPQPLTAAPESDATDEQSDQKTPALDFFAKDLTKPETMKTIDPVVGREAEIERVTQILCRRTKNNPILVGEPGVGKTAIVEGLARKIVERDVPDILIGKRILALDLALVVAGTIYRGEFESRLKQILDEVRQDKSLVLFIDEIHTIMGAGAASGSLDAANILKPALARGDIRCIGATTADEYRKHVEHDAALERRFQVVEVTEPSPGITAEILRGLKPYYEQFHRVSITDEAIDASVRFAERYLTDRHFPDKAIDLVDEAAARLRVHATNDPLLRRASAIEAKIETAEEEKRRCVLEERFDDAAAIQRDDAKHAKELTAIHERLRERPVVTVGAISTRDVAAVVAQMIKLPVEEVLLEEHERFRALGEVLGKRIVGQEDAIRAIAAALQRAKSGLAHPNRPLASFLLLGPTGVGKTETAAAIADLLFQRRDALIRLDMSEFSEGFTISKLIGAPAGYVGYREGAKLTDSVRKRPASVVLFDEIEKAHADVWNLLLQILEDGRLTDATGRETRFTNTIVILTSNIGAEAFTQSTIGFTGSQSAQADAAARFANVRQDALRELRHRFRPELLNRIDETIIYRPLERGHLATITGMELAAFAERLLREQKITAQWTDAVTEWIASRAFDPAQGARAVRRLLHEHVENPLASGILEERFRTGSTIALEVTNDGTLALNVVTTPSRARTRVKARV